MCCDVSEGEALFFSVTQTKTSEYQSEINPVTEAVEVKPIEYHH